MIKNLVLLTGEDDYRLHERRKFYEHHFRQKYADGEIELFDEQGSFHDLEGAVMTQNLFGGKRLVLTKGFWKADNFEKAEKAGFFDKLPDMSDFVTLIVLEPKLDKRLKSSKFLLREAKDEHFDLLDENQTIDWVLKFVMQQEGKIQRLQAQELVKRCGINLWNLSQELKKLISAHEEGIVTSENIQEMTLPHPQVIMWDFLEHVSHRRTAKALKSFQDLLTMGHTVYELLPMIMREVRIHALLRDGLNRGLPAKAIPADAKLHPFVVQKTLKATQRFSDHDITKFYDQLFDLDKKIKTGGVVATSGDTSEIELQIEKFIIA